MAVILSDDHYQHLMKTTGKIIGSLVGLTFGGPIGLVFGFILGHLYDIGYFGQFASVMKNQGRAYTHTHVQQIFFNNTFKIMGYIAKSDGRVSESEIQVARIIMQQMGLNEALKSQAMQLFNIGKQPSFNLDAALNEIRQACFMQPALLQLFLDIQYQMAAAEGGLTAAKQATLQNIRNKLGVAGFNGSQQQQTGSDYQQSHQYRQRATGRQQSFNLPEAYQLLSVSKNASNDEVKKAYRKQMSQNHPDKLIAKGLPPEMIKVATEKTQRIKEAYEIIKRSRGL